MPTPLRLPADNTLSYLLLTLTAISGEFPTSQVARLPGGASYKENLLTQMRRTKLIRTFYRNGLRGLRLTAHAKGLLLERHPERFRPYLTGSAETNVLKSEVPRRLRLHQMAEVLVTMFNAGLFVFNWEKEAIFKPKILSPVNPVHLPAYYHSREVKELGQQAVKIRGSRSTGVLITDGGFFLVYNTGPSLMKWEYTAEMRMKNLMQTEVCNRRLASRFRNTAIQGIVFGSSMDVLHGLMSDRHNYFILDGNLAGFHFLTSDHRGEVILQLLCKPGQHAVLDYILCENLSPKQPGWTIEHDAIDETGAPVLFAYTCDMPRIRRFDTALELQGQVGTLICFDFQEPILRRVCGPRVTFQCIDFVKFERSVLHPEEGST